MRMIDVEEDVYTHIAQNTQEIGESASDILRRLLKLPKPGTSIRLNGAQHEFVKAIEDPRFRVQSAAVDKMLYFLSVAYGQKKSDFEKVLAIQGRDRKYFARTSEEIERSGNSTQPRQIPGTPFWVMTNSPTQQKASMLEEALRILNYSNEAIEAAVTTIR